MHKQHHWDNVYQTKDSARVSWYAPSLETSLQLIRQLAPAPDTVILDVGSGASLSMTCWQQTTMSQHNAAGWMSCVTTRRHCTGSLGVLSVCWTA
jgi:hypothetical protein